jgi:hypothetical protein
MPSSENPWNSAQNIEMDDLSLPTPTASSVRNAQREASNPALSRKKTFVTGIVLLMLVVLLWTSSNFLTQVRALFCMMLCNINLC